MTKKVLVFAGSNHSTSINHTLAQAAAKLLENADITIVRLTDFELPIFSEDLEKDSGIPKNAQKFYDLVKAHDGFIIALPEYNGSMSAVFKNTIDWISRIEWPLFDDKPVLLLSTSFGKRGGKTNVEHLQNLMPYWKAAVTGVYSLGQFGEHYDTEKKTFDVETMTALGSHVKTFEAAL